MNKNNLSEADISDKFVRPAVVQAGWHTLDQIAEQTRIVTRVEELMRLCDAFEAKGQLAATAHAQLASTRWPRSPTAKRPRNWPTTGTVSPPTSTCC
jgi:hypothetical protein